MGKKAAAIVRLAVLMAFCLAAYGSTFAAGADSTGSVTIADSTGTGIESLSENANSPAEKFVYHTSAEMLDFLKPYVGEEELKWGDIEWVMKGDEINLSGYLTPGKNAFTSICATYRTKEDGNQTQPEEILGAFYADLCDKSGTIFPGADDLIRSISTLEDRQLFRNEPWAVKVSKSGNTCSVEMYRTEASVDSIPYMPVDAAAFMENYGGEYAQISRAVSGIPKNISDSETETFTWEASLDVNERLRHINAKYYGEDPAEGKAFFTALTEFFLTGDVLE